MTKYDYAYLAGYTDGEGHFGFTRSSPRFEVTNTCPIVLLKLKTKFGGEVRLSTVSSKLNRRHAWRYSAHVASIPKILKKILPFLVEKKPQALLLLEYMSIAKNAGSSVRKAEIQATIAQLKRISYFPPQQQQQH